MVDTFSVKEIHNFQKKALRILRVITAANYRLELLLREQERLKETIHNVGHLHQTEADMLVRYLVQDKTAQKSATICRKIHKQKPEPRLTMLVDELSSLVKRLQQAKAEIIAEKKKKTPKKGDVWA
jgi:chromatin segregation and condensation protein Rec8/ScpA/Scc1 (kleisin family)